jgi:hypothetical protein
LKCKLSKYIATYIIFIFTIILYAFVNRDTNLNDLQIYSMFVFSFLFLFYNIYKRDILYFTLIVVMFFSAYYNINSFRLSTILYSCMFIFTYLLYLKATIIGKMTISYYMTVLKIIIYSYTIVLIIQQVSTLMNIPVFNQCWVFSTNKMKLNSLSLEPSNTTLILPLLMLSYAKMQEILNKKDYLELLHIIIKKDKIVWVAFFYVMLTCGSMTTFFSLPVFFLYFFRKRINPLKIISIIFIICLISYISITFNKQAYIRFSELLSLFTSTPDVVLDQDASASVRIVPYIEYFKSINIFNIRTWLGHGIDSSELFYTDAIVGDSDRKIGAMNITSLFYDYGLIAGLIFILAIKKAIAHSFFSYEMLFYFLLFSVLPINHYVLWLFMILMSTNYIFKKAFDNDAKVDQLNINSKTYEYYF